MCHTIISRDADLLVAPLLAAGRARRRGAERMKLVERELEAHLQRAAPRRDARHTHTPFLRQWLLPAEMMR